MIVAVLFMITLIVLVGWPSSMYLFYRANHLPMPASVRLGGATLFTAAIALSISTWWLGMRSGVRALHDMGR